MRFADGKWTRYTTKDGLKDDTVWQIAEDPDGSIWIGYHDADGLTHLTFPPIADAKPEVEHFTTANGLQSDKLLFLGFDGLGQTVGGHGSWGRCARSQRAGATMDAPTA